MAIQNLTRLYEGEPLAGANGAVIFLPVEFDCEIKRVKVKLEEAASGGDVVFNLSETGGAIISGSTLTIEDGASEAILDGLAIERLEDEDLLLNMVSGAVNSTITLNLRVEDGETGVEIDSTDDVPEGATNKYFTAARVWATVLTGIVFTANSAVTAADSVLIALGKLQAQITALISSVATNTANIATNTTAIGGKVSSNAAIAGATKTKITYDAKGLVTAGADATSDDVSEGATNLYFTAARVRAAVLTGVSFATNSAILATDTLLIALGKLQAQISNFAESQLNFTDITTGNVSTTKHGFAPKLPNDATKYLDGTGAYTVPAGTGGGGTTLPTGDLNAATNVLEKLRGKAVSATVPTDNQAYVFDNAANQFKPVSVMRPGDTVSSSSGLMTYQGKTVIPISAAGDFAGTLASGNQLGINKTASYARFYSLKASGNITIRDVASNTTPDTFGTLYRVEDNTIVATDDDTGGNGKYLVSANLGSTPKTYVFEHAAYGAGDVGAFIVRFTGAGIVEQLSTSIVGATAAGGDLFGTYPNPQVNRVTGIAVPATSTSTGAKGDIAFDATYIYICVATNSWKRIALAAF